MPQISIIIPLYNKQKHIARCLDSILKQTYNNFEIIVIDDGSNDNGPQIVKKYNDPRIKIITQANKGPGTARNRGVEIACAPYVSFLDADDEWTESFLDVSYKTLISNSEAVLTTCHFWINSIGNRWSGHLKLNLQEGYYDIGTDLPPEKLQYVIGAIHSAGSVLCKKEIILKYDGFFENNCKFAEDQYLWLQVILNHKIYIIKQNLMVYHLENSDLFIKGAKKRNVFSPILTNPAKIRSVCPPSKINLLETYFGYMALREAHNYFSKTTFPYICQFLKDFQSMRNWKIQYINLIIKIILFKLHIYKGSKGQS